MTVLEYFGPSHLGLTQSLGSEYSLSTQICPSTHHLQHLAARVIRQPNTILKAFIAAIMRTALALVLLAAAAVATANAQSELLRCLPA